MNCLYLHDRRERGPKISSWYIFHHISEELKRRGHQVNPYSITYNHTNDKNVHWSDEDWHKADILCTVFGHSEGPLKVAKGLGIPSFLEIGYACPQVVNDLIEKELNRLGLSKTETLMDVKNFSRSFYDLPTKIIGPGSKSYNEASYRQIGVQNAHFFQMGVDTDLYVPDFSLRSKDKIRFCLTAAALTFRKGAFYLANAWRKIPKKYHPKIELHLTGQIVDYTVTGKIITSLKNDYGNVFTHGFVSNTSKEYLKIHSFCDVMIFPTLGEGQAATVLEGLSFGLYPIVSPYTGTDFGGIPGVMLNSKPTVWESEIESAIENVIENFAQIRKTPSKLRAIARDRFKWSRFAIETVDFIEANAKHI